MLKSADIDENNQRKPKEIGVFGGGGGADASYTFGI